jgi:hypothetical protein
MSTFVPKPNTGTLFNNERKDPGSTQPDMKGNIFLDRALIDDQLKGTPEGELVKFEISGWDNGSRMGLALSKPYVKPENKSIKKSRLPNPSPTLTKTFLFNGHATVRGREDGP